MSATQPVTRLFRVDSPADVVCAGLVANHLEPGRDVLALCSDHISGDFREYSEATRALAAIHPWSAIIDTSGTPLNQRSPHAASWSQRTQRWVDTVRWLRERVASAAVAVDEIYVASLDHPDVLALFRAFPRARKCCFPHGFDKWDRYAIEYYRAFCDPAAQRSLASKVVDVCKWALWGPDAQYDRSLKVDRAYSFALPVPWAKQSHVLSAVICQETMQRLFGQLPGAVQEYYHSVAGRCGEGTWLLLLSPPEARRDRIMQTYVAIARAMVARGAKAILCKPHPRHSKEHGAEAGATLRQHFPGLPVHLVEEHHYFPMEIAFAPFQISGCGSLASTSMLMLSRLFHVPALCPDLEAIRAFATDGKERETLDRWYDDNRELFTPIGSTVEHLADRA